MKTALACIILCIAALIFGKRQNSRIAELEQRIATTEIPFRLERPSPDEARADYRSKYRQREATLTAPEVFETVLSLVKSRSVSGGPQVVMENREAFQAMLKLDLEGQKELIRLIATSKDPRLGNGRDTLQKCEQINVCLIAMADQDPETALEYLRNCDERIGKFYRDRLGMDSMIQYAIQRMCEHDPEAGLKELVAEAGKGDDSGNTQTAAQILASVAEHQPELAIEMIPRLPEKFRPDAIQRVFRTAENDEDLTRYFKIVRDGLTGDRNSQHMVFQAILSQMTKRGKVKRSWKEQAKLIEGLDLTNEEKNVYCIGTYGCDVVDSPDVARWLADFLPPSKERDFTLWSKAQGYWMASDPEEAKAFLQQHNIDVKEMERLEKEGFYTRRW